MKFSYRLACALYSERSIFGGRAISGIGVGSVYSGDIDDIVTRVVSSFLRTFLSRAARNSTTRTMSKSDAIHVAVFLGG